MANETVEILRIEFDADAAIKNTVELKKQRDSLRQTIKELSKDEAANAQEIQKLTVETKVLSGQIREQEKVSENLIRIKKEEAGSNQALKAELSKLTSEYNRLSKEQRLTSDTGLSLKGRITDITNELKANESAIGNNFRNVGNYKSALEAIPGPIGNVTKGIGGFNNTLKANPILAIVGIVQVFIGILQKLQPVVDFVEQAVGALNAVFDVLLSRFQMILDGNFIEAFTGIGSAISDAAKAGADYAKALQDADDAQRLFNITNAQAEKQIAALSAQLKDRTKTDKERLAIADQITKIETENFNKQKSLLEGNLKREEKELKLSLQRKNISTANLQTTEQLINAAQKSGKISDEQLDKVIAASTAFINAEKDSLALTERINVRRNAILDQQEEKRKAAEEKQAAREAKALAEREKYLQEIDKLEEKYILTDRLRLQKSFDNELNAIKGNSKEEQALREKIARDQQAALDKFDQEAAKKRAENLEAIQIATFNKRASDAENLLQIELSRAEREIKNEKELALAKEKINLQYLQDRLKDAQTLANALGVPTSEQIANIEKLETAVTNAQTNIKKLQETDPPQTIGQLIGATPEDGKIIDESIAQFQQSLSSVIGIIKERYATELDNIEQTRDAEIEAIKASELSEADKSEKINQINKKAAQQKYEIQVKEFNAEKALQITNAIISGATAAIKAFAQLGPIAGPIAAAVVGGISAAQIAIIASQQPPPPPKFATGVVGLNGPGNSTSDSIPAMLSNGESVITASGTRFAETFYPGLLNFLNSKNKFADGVVNFQQPVGQSTNISIAAELRAAIQDLTIVTKVSDIEKATFDRQSVRTVGVI